MIVSGIILKKGLGKSRLYFDKKDSFTSGGCAGCIPAWVWVRRGDIPWAEGDIIADIFNDEGDVNETLTAVAMTVSYLGFD